MLKKPPLEDVKLVRERRKKNQQKAQEEKVRLQNIAQARRDALDKERSLRNEASQAKQAKPKKKTILPRKNPIDLNDVINSIEQGIPFLAEDIAQKLNLDFSKGSPNRLHLANAPIRQND